MLGLLRNDSGSDFEGDFSEEIKKPKEPDLTYQGICRCCKKTIPEEDRYIEYATTKDTHTYERYRCQECEAANPPSPIFGHTVGYHYGVGFHDGKLEKKTLTNIYIMSTERKHAAHSPSSWLYKSRCSGFTNDQDRDATAANKGEFLHLCVEKENLDLTPPSGVEYDEYGRKAAQMCLDYITHVKSEMSKPQVFKEEKLEMLGQWGFADMVILDGDTAHLIDFKFAWNAYKADGFQFKGYTLGVVNKWPFVKKVVVHVLHPFIDLIDLHEFTDFAALLEECGVMVAAAQKADPATFRTGDYCTYCGRKAECPKLNEMALAISTKYQPEELAIPEELLPENITDPQIVAKGMIVAPVMEEWCRKIKKRALELRMQEGVEIPGFELKERSASFSINNAQAAWEAVKDTISPEEYAGCAEVKIGALEKVFAEKAPRGQKTTSKAQLRDKLLDAGAARQEGVVHFLKRIKQSTTVTLTDGSNQPG